MKKFILFISIIVPFMSFSQTEKETSKKILAEFEGNNNINKYQNIYGLFSDEKKTALPIEQITVVRYENKTYASYKKKFERASLAENILFNNNYKINGSFVKPFNVEDLPKPERKTTKLKLPFKGEWTVLWGGDTKELNYHVQGEAIKHAFDFVITDEKNKTFKTDGSINEDYYAFGKEIIAPCDGEIISVVNGILDNKPGVLSTSHISGNAVIIKTENNEYIFLSHFKNNSIKVKQGQKIKQGQLLGLCGNSGSSSEPHLHFHIQNVVDKKIARGVKCHFQEIYVNKRLKNDYSPIRGEKIKNK